MTQRASFATIAPALVVLVLLVAGCTRKTSDKMTELTQPVAGPPAGQVLVGIHLPRFHSGSKWSYVFLWDGETFVGEINSGHSAYYVCKPGRHTFVGLHSTAASVIEANLSANRIYDLFVDRQVKGWTEHMVLTPIRRGDEEREEIAEWLEELTPMVVNRAATAEYEKEHRAEVAQAIADFTTGEKKHRLLKMTPDDHR